MNADTIVAFVGLAYVVVMVALIALVSISALVVAL